MGVTVGALSVLGVLWQTCGAASGELFPQVDQGLGCPCAVKAPVLQLTPHGLTLLEASGAPGTQSLLQERKLNCLLCKWVQTCLLLE